MKTRPNESVNVYLCTTCHKYHIGHKPGSNMRGQRNQARLRRVLEEAKWQETMSRLPDSIVDD